MTRRAAQQVAALIAALLVVIAWWREWWPFASHPKPLSAYAHPTVWQLLLSDRATLGFVRALIAALALYVVASVPALVVGARWLRGFGTSGVTADDAQEASKAIADYRDAATKLRDDLRLATTEAARLRLERDELRQHLSRALQSQGDERRGAERAAGDAPPPG